MKKLLVTLIKIGLSLGIVAFLIWNSVRNDKSNAFSNLLHEPKDWKMFVGAYVMCATAALITFVRWWYLVRSLNVPCKLIDALRISFWGYLFNLAPLGIVGGDLVKAVMLSHEHRQFRPHAVASVIVDRIIGLYVLFVVCSAAMFLTGFAGGGDPQLQKICFYTYVITSGATVGIALSLSPVLFNETLIGVLEHLPKVGEILTKLIEAWRIYRNRPLVLLNASLMTVPVHCCFAVGIYLISQGLPGDVHSLNTHVHSLKAHLVVAPLSSAAQVIPLPMGPQEGVLDYLYSAVPEAGVSVPAGQGIIVTLGYRLMTICIAGLGIPFYFRNRGEVSQALHEEEAIEEKESKHRKP